MANFRPLLISLLLFGLLAAAMINIGVMLAVSNNADESILNNSAIYAYSVNLSNDLNDANGQAEGSYESFSNSTFSFDKGVVWLDAIGGLWQTLISVPGSIFTLTTELIKEQLLSNTGFYIVFGVITLILSITIILSVWKLVSTGESG